MIEKLMTLLVGILLALAGWTLTRTFDLSTTQAVQLDKVDKLERHVERLQLKIMEKDLVENTEFRIKWPRGLL